MSARHRTVRQLLLVAIARDVADLVLCLVLACAGAWLVWHVTNPVPVEALAAGCECPR